MRWQKILSTSLLMGVLTACDTLALNEAEPEKYSGLDCEQLDQLAESYRTQDQLDLFNDNNISERERLGDDPADRSLGQTNTTRTEFQANLDRDRRSIAVARRHKGCN